jgi:hypothetical protein
MLRLTASRPVPLGINHPSAPYDQIFITVRQLRVCWCGALSLTRAWVCHLQLLLSLASAVTLGSESRGIRDHILLPSIRHFLFRCLLRLAGLRWRYLTPPPCRILQLDLHFLLCNFETDRRKISFISVATEMIVDRPYPASTETSPGNGLVTKNPSPRKHVCRPVPYQWIYTSHCVFSILKESLMDE